MILYPAIDLKGGQFVRLLRGDMDRATIFGSDPAAQARAFAAAGSTAFVTTAHVSAPQPSAHAFGRPRRAREHSGTSIANARRRHSCRRGESSGA